MAPHSVRFPTAINILHSNMKIIWTKKHFIINGNTGNTRQVCVIRKKPDDMIGCEATRVRVSERKRAGSLTLTYIRGEGVRSERGEQLASGEHVVILTKALG